MRVSRAVTESVRTEFVIELGMRGGAALSFRRDGSQSIPHTMLS